jgi:hypothetical protein
MAKTHGNKRKPARIARRRQPKGSFPHTRRIGPYSYIRECITVCPPKPGEEAQAARVVKEGS